MEEGLQFLKIAESKFSTKIFNKYFKLTTGFTVSSNVISLSSISFIVFFSLESLLSIKFLALTILLLEA